MPPDVRQRADTALIAAAAELARGHRLVAAHVPMIGEPGGAGLPAALAEVAELVLLPVLRPDRDLDWARYEPSEALIGSAAGGLLREPAGLRLGPDTIRSADLILVPALAVDRAGLRLGRGGGSFDRALARVPAGTPIIALLYEGELRDRVPAQPHDRAVTAVLTPDGLVVFSG